MGTDLTTRAGLSRFSVVVGVSGVPLRSVSCRGGDGSGQSLFVVSDTGVWGALAKDDVGGCHGRDGVVSGFEVEVVDDLDGHQRHDPVWSGLDFYLGHAVVTHDPGDHAGELVAGRGVRCYVGAAGCAVE